MTLSIALERKARSEQILLGAGIPVNEALPAIEPEDEVRLRTKEEISDRVLALCYIALKAEDADPDFLDRFFTAYRVDNKLTPLERAFVSQPHPSEQDRRNATWRYESIWVLLWALNYAERLDAPFKLCDVGAIAGIVSGRTEDSFKENAVVRDKKEILDEADLIYRYHWACREALLNEAELPSDLNYSIVYERHVALNWLIRYHDQDWDEVTTDT